MNVEIITQLSDSAANTVENLAYRLAERQGGRIAPIHLLPYLPVSLGIIKDCLDKMVDGTAVLSHSSDHITEYQFASYVSSDANPELGALRVSSCLSCDADIAYESGEVLCAYCTKILFGELGKLAEKTGWPAQAVYEHEILYIASTSAVPVHAEDLAGRSRYTLRNMRQKLDKMILSGFLREELDQKKRSVTYHFPNIEYPRSLYRRNMGIIRTYPASVMEEVQLKVTKIFLTFGSMFLGMVVLAFLRIPYPLLILLFFIAAPIVSLLIWRHRATPEE